MSDLDGFDRSRGERGGSSWKKDARSGGQRPERSERLSGRDGRGERSFSDRDSRPRREGERGFGDRPRRDGDRQRPGRAGDGRSVERPAWQQRVDRERDPNKPKSPMIPEEITEKDLDLLVRVQMKTLSPENAERVSRHLAMVNLLIDQDPELAHQHALAAAERAGRIGVVRETLGLTAYTVGDYGLALRELQAYRRITGSNDQVPVMVDCERGLGRPDKALELARQVDPAALPAGVRVNLAIAVSGARLDRGENVLALAELEIPELNPENVHDYSPHLFRAYADTLEILGRESEAKKWWGLADRADAALAAKKAPAVEVQDVIEELTIPEPYTAREERTPRNNRGDRDKSGDRGERDNRGDWTARPDRNRDNRSLTPRDTKPTWKKRDSK